VNLALMGGAPLPKPAVSNQPGSPGNPLAGAFKTSDGRYIMMSMLQPTKYWPEFCARMERPDLLEDPRFVGEEILKNGYAGGAYVAEIVASMPLAEWERRMAGAEGQWALVQNTYEVGMDPSLRANGFIAKVTDADGIERELVANPVQFDETPVVSKRAPQFAEHTDEIVRELGHDDEELINLKIAGAIT
jgi:crotonobetainyl-CoA:carnitine CoA-transferase CaiB-like acyl-CoA transferase